MNKGHAKKHENSIPYGRSVDLKVLFDFSSLSSCNPLANIQSIVFNTIQLLWRLKIAVISCILAPIFLPYISIILSTKSIDYNSIEYIGMHSTCSVFDFLFQDSIFFLAVVNLALWLHNLLRNLVESVVLVIFFLKAPAVNINSNSSAITTKTNPTNMGPKWLAFVNRCCYAFWHSSFHFTAYTIRSFYVHAFECECECLTKMWIIEIRLKDLIQIYARTNT